MLISLFSNAVLEMEEEGIWNSIRASHLVLVLHDDVHELPHLLLQLLHGSLLLLPAPSAPAAAAARAAQHDVVVVVRVVVLATGPAAALLLGLQIGTGKMYVFPK